MRKYTFRGGAKDLDLLGEKAGIVLKPFKMAFNERKGR
jgi:hypothetical protein